MGFKRVFEIERNGRRRRFTLQSTVIESFSVHNSNASVERSLSDKKNICTVLQTQLSDATLIGLGRLTEYARQNKGG